MSFNITQQYNISGNAVAFLNSLDNAATRSASSLASIARTITGFSAFGLLLKGIHAAKEGLFDFNLQMQKTETTIASQLLLTGMAATWNKATVSAKAMNEELFRFSLTAPGSWQDYIQTANVLTGTLGILGSKGTGDVTRLTESIVALGKATGRDIQTLQREVAATLTTGVIRRNETQLIAFLATLGKTAEQFKKMTVAQQVAFLENAAKTENGRKAILEYGKTAEGMIDNLRGFWLRFSGEVGKPVFTAITGEISELNEWLVKNEDTTKRWAKILADDVLSVFTAIKSTIGFIKDNSDIILTALSAYAGYKLAGRVSGALGAGGIGGRIATLSNPIPVFVVNQGFGGGGVGTAASAGLLATIIEGLPVLTVGAILGLQVGKGLVDYVDQHPFIHGAMRRVFGDTDQDVARKKSIEGLFKWTDEAEEQTKHTKSIIDTYLGLSSTKGVSGQQLVAQKQLSIEEIQKNQSGLIDELKSLPNAIRADKFGRVSFDPYSFRAAEIQKGRDEYTVKRWTEVSQTLVALLNRIGIAMDVFGLKPDDKHKPLTRPGDLNVVVKMEVASEDPDRFAINFVEKLTQLNNARTRGFGASRNR